MKILSRGVSIPVVLFLLNSIAPVFSEEHGNQCTQISLDIERLYCFDKKYHTPSHNINKKTQREGPFRSEVKQIPSFIKQIYAFEDLRPADSYGFLVNQVNDKHSSTMILSAPARGSYLYRPLLVIACIDNITRLQVLLHQPLSQKAVQVQLDNSDSLTTKQYWKVLQDGYLLEAGRGLHSIKMIIDFFQHEALAMELKDTDIGQLDFDIKGLSETIKPLRAACHW